MQLGQTGHSCLRWIALIGAMVLLAACQSTASLNPASPESKRASAQPAAPILSRDTSSFIGLGGEDLSRALGQPKLVRKDAPAEIWQYSGADCVVDFYLYTGVSGLSVAYLEARDSAALSTPADRCVKSLLQSVSADTEQKAL